MVVLLKAWVLIWYYLFSFRFRIQKSLFILFQIVTIISFSLIYAIPENRGSISVELDCNGGITVLKSCYADIQHADQCKIDSLGKDPLPTSCRVRLVTRHNNPHIK